MDMVSKIWNYIDPEGLRVSVVLCLSFALISCGMSTFHLVYGNKGEPRVITIEGQKECKKIYFGVSRTKFYSAYGDPCNIIIERKIR